MLKCPPERIICLSNETVETIYLLGEEKRIVGVTGFAVRPMRVRREKPRISSFKSANIAEILDLKPDIIFTFSDVQAELSRDLIHAGLNVFCFNQRSVAGILSMITMIGAMLNCCKKAEGLTNEIKKNIHNCRSTKPMQSPKVYFEEWDEPLISGIRWVSEIIEIAGGKDIFSKKSLLYKAENRCIGLNEVIRENPDIIIASWCGKKVDFSTISSRNGWQDINAVKFQNIYGINSMEILQPGPAALTDGLARVRNIILGFQGGV